MSKHIAYLPFYVRDFLCDGKVLLMDWMEQALYTRMLFASWELGPIPDDLRRRNLMLQIPALEMTFASEGAKLDIQGRVEHVLETAWTLTPAGWINERLELERARSAEKIGAYRAKTEAATAARQAARQRDVQRDVERDVQRDVDLSLSQISETRSTTGSLSVPATVEITGTPSPLKPAAPEAQHAPEPEKKAQKPRKKSSEPRAEPTGPLADCIRGFDELCIEHMGEPWSWDGKNARAMASVVKKAQENVPLVLARARRMFTDPPDQWYAQNASPWLLDNRWTNLAVRAHVTPTAKQAARNKALLDKVFDDATLRLEGTSGTAPARTPLLGAG